METELIILLQYFLHLHKNILDMMKYPEEMLQQILQPGLWNKVILCDKKMCFVMSAYFNFLLDFNLWYWL